MNNMTTVWTMTKRWNLRIAVILLAGPCLSCQNASDTTPKPDTASQSGNTIGDGEARTEKTPRSPAENIPSAKTVTAKTVTVRTVTVRTVTVRTVDPAGYAAELKKHRGKVIVVDFWATWCIPCLKEFSHTLEWDKRFRDQGLVVISMSMDDTDKDSRAAVLDFLKKRNATLTNLQSRLGGEEEAMKAFSINDGALPHFKIYGRDGTLFKTFGFNPKKPFHHADVETALRDALKRSSG